MDEKRGLSEIIATLIIILITLVAIGIIWVVINGILKTGTQQIANSQNNVDLQITKVQVASNNITVSVYVKRNSGQGNFIAMDFIFNNGTDTEIIRENQTIPQLGQQSFSFILSKLPVNTLKSVSVAPVFQSGSTESVGNPTSTFDVSKIVASVGAPLITGFEAMGFGGMKEVDYNISNGNPVTYPEFKNFTVNPLDVSVGQNQTFSVTVYSPNNVTNVTSFTQLDHDNLSLNFVKFSDDGIGNSIWNVTWTAYDTHGTTYSTNVTAIDSAGNQNSINMEWTDTTDCNNVIPLSAQGSPYPLYSNCVVGSGEAGGLTGARLTITSGITVTVTAGTLVTNGFTLSGGHIALASGATIRTTGYLYYFDSDNDGYADNATGIYSATTKGAGYVLASPSVHALTDCNPTNPNENTLQTGYIDADGDGYPGTAVSNACLPANTVYPSSTDCFDSNANARPNQTGWFTTDRGDGSYDYDCNSGSTPETLSGTGSMPGNGKCDDNSHAACDNIYPDGVAGFATITTCGQNGTWIVPGLVCGDISCSNYSKQAVCSNAPTLEYTNQTGVCDTNSGNPCDNLYPNGKVGFIGAKPSVGSTGTYVSDPGLKCADPVQNCVYGTVTQAVH
ncbi:MAG: archaellin/type IV pilin N-terminal domain-containing protein [Candidatus Pacearchaeota archaeon]|jgi:flagellin-like protein